MTEQQSIDQGTMYHASIMDLRSELVKSYSAFGADAEKYSKIVFAHRREGGRKPTDAERDAYGASLMASGYAYTLAAIIKLAEQDFGPEVAHALANEADNILTNGDGREEWNADVMPESKETTQ
jgi:hypothetical protein